MGIFIYEYSNFQFKKKMITINIRIDCELNEILTNSIPKKMINQLVDILGRFHLKTICKAKKNSTKCSVYIKYRLLL